MAVVVQEDMDSLGFSGNESAARESHRVVTRSGW